MNIEEFDKELIDFLHLAFQVQKINNLKVSSLPLDDDIYRIRFENDEMVFQCLYEKECDDCEAQIRITNILLKGSLKNRGISKYLINALLVYCRKHGSMSLWIYELINQSWCNYLLQHGAVMFQEESLYEGAVLLIPDLIE